MLQTCDPFISRFEPPLVGKVRSGPLAGLSVSVKDGFDIAGHVTGAGSPEWAKSHSPATKTSPVVEALMDAGALVVGKTQMDELAYSLMGVNARYGTPLNPAAPDRVPGGSSSGSAASVTAGSVDIGLGSDTGGSVRLPASFCGIFGWRPTHGSLSSENLVPLAPSYDTPAFFTRDLATMALIGSVFAPLQVSSEPVDLWLPSDLWSLAQEPVADALRAGLPAANYRSGPLLPDGNLSDWLTVFRTHQAYEIWRALGPWILETQPDFGPGIQERFQMASTITKEAFSEAATRRAAIRAYLETVVTPETILVVPTSPGVAPLRSTPQGDLEVFRNAALTMLCVAGHAGLPQLSIPLAIVDGSPVGLSLVGARGMDTHLISIADRFPVRMRNREGSAT
jgi:amidase